MVTGFDVLPPVVLPPVAEPTIDETPVLTDEIPVS
jgi:hypothetical protein